MSKLWLTFYGDDFTGSTDALEQLTLAGLRCALFIAPPGKAQLKRYAHLEAVGVAGLTRSMAPAAMEKTLRPAFRKLKALGARQVHYKVCSTFDSSPRLGNIGKVIELGQRIFPGSFVPIVAAAPALGRYTIFGTHFARFGIGSEGAIHRLDRHPAISRHPITPMTEADLRRHLARQTRCQIALCDVLRLRMSAAIHAPAFKELLRARPDGVLFDAMDDSDVDRIGRLLGPLGTVRHPLFSVGSSAIEAALAGYWERSQDRRRKKAMTAKPKAVGQILIGSGSCSTVTQRQIRRALSRGFSEVALDAAAFVSKPRGERELMRAAVLALARLKAGESVVVHTTRDGGSAQVARRLKHRTAEILGTAVGRVLREILAAHPVPRICVAGGDTSSFAARALGIEALEISACLTPGAPLCRVQAPGSPAHGLEFVFKGGQVGAEDYFETVRNPQRT